MQKKDAKQLRVYDRVFGEKRAIFDFPKMVTKGARRV